MKKLQNQKLIVSLFTIFVLIISSQAILSNTNVIQEHALTFTSTNYTIVDTGLTICYDNSITISYPLETEPFYGQDAQYIGNHPSYQNNGDGTITDLNTVLMWQQDSGEKITYSTAVSGADTFTLAGFDDWRLPSIKELYSLINFNGTDPSGLESSDNLIPFIDTDYFIFEYGNEAEGERIIDAQYWSSTEYVSTTMNGAATVFGVNFADGRIKGYPRDLGPGDQPMQMFTIYVRGKENYGINDFGDNSDGTITDRATGLMWSKTDSGEGMNWENALSWVQQKNDENYLGYDDWCLPNAKEMQSIVDYSRAPRTSTTHRHVLDGSNAVYIAFGEALGWMQDPITLEYELQDVHGAGAQRSDPKIGDADDYPYGHGPQGDVIRINNYVRCVRGGVVEKAESEDDYSKFVTTQEAIYPFTFVGIYTVVIFALLKKRKKETQCLSS